MAPVECTCTVVVMDVEGTTSAAEYVYNVLFPFARARIADWISVHSDEPTTTEAVAAVASHLGTSPDDTDAVIGQLLRWIDDDVKAPPLKTLQGLIWGEGYRSGDLTSHFFADVEPALRAWKAQGVRLAVYSSGSVAAQKSLFAHSATGNLDDLIDANFDITTAGPKREAASYRSIARDLDTEPSRILFLSDIQDEIDAARAAGWQAVGVRREGEHQATAADPPVIESFAELFVIP